MATVDEIQRLLKIPIDQLETEVIEAVISDGDLMTRLVPETVPPTPYEEFIESWSPKEKRKEVLEFIKRDFDRMQADLRELVCVKLQYCKVKKNGGLIALIMAIGWHYVPVAVATAVTSVLWVVPSILVYLERIGYFDKLCGCKD